MLHTSSIRIVSAIFAGMLLLVSLGACSPAATEPPQGDPPFAVIAAERALSDALGIPVDDIDYASYERHDWPNACLGRAEEGEACAEVITPGWRVVLTAQGEEFVFRTDKDGEHVRREN